MTLRNSIVWLVALLMTVFSSSAQFTYLEAGIGYNSVTFNKQYGHKLMELFDLNVTLV